ncbi:hypothetical protein EDB19DRAFT_1918511 [Suillus lakei]|nr:hypothetical protein EDB19DRAFT_1918511 [Suillus lakei]
MPDWSKLDSQNIDWSKVSGNVLSRASDVLTEARQLVNQAASQNDIDLQNVDWSKLSTNVVSRASDALTDAKQLVNRAVSEKDLDLTNINWSQVSGNILSSVLFPLTEVNNWSIRHPYKSAGALLFISASTDPGMLLTLLQLTKTATTFLCFLPVRLIMWGFGFGSRGVEKGAQIQRFPPVN